MTTAFFRVLRPKFQATFILDTNPSLTSHFPSISKALLVSTSGYIGIHAFSPLPGQATPISHLDGHKSLLTNLLASALDLLSFQSRSQITALLCPKASKASPSPPHPPHWALTSLTSSSPPSLPQTSLRASAVTSPEAGNAVPLRIHVAPPGLCSGIPFSKRSPVYQIHSLSALLFFFSCSSPPDIH